ncbi:MAG TPA: hypothetical protein VJ583_09515 [Nitrososphaeraceae archaeon]|nr:hypothetical protein [Nitrososphaeraceae archaeon]
MVCKGICIRHKAIKPKSGQRYTIGQKRCQVCQIFIYWQGPWCPCCGYRLRGKPRNSKFKEMMLNTIIKN